MTLSGKKKMKCENLSLCYSRKPKKTVKITKKRQKKPSKSLFGKLDAGQMPHGWQEIFVSFCPIYLLFFCFDGEIFLFQMTKKISILIKQN